MCSTWVCGRSLRAAWNSVTCFGSEKGVSLAFIFARAAGGRIQGAALYFSRPGGPAPQWPLTPMSPLLCIRGHGTSSSIHGPASDETKLWLLFFLQVQALRTNCLT